MNDLRKFIKTTIREFLNENNLDGYHLEPYHKSSYHKYEQNNDLEFKIVRGIDGKLWGIDVYKLPYKTFVGTIEISYKSDIPSFEKQRDGQPNIDNISIDERFRNQGFAKILYKKLISELKKDGYKKLFAGLTRNSIYVNNIWNRLKDGEIQVDYDGRIKTIEFINL
jgi:ribosomal protein S18 acetylase RimI-like enzyme